MNKNRLTQSIIFSLVTLVASVNWYFLKKTLDCAGCFSWLWPILISVIFFALIGISWFLVNSKLVVFMTSFAVVVSYLLVFGFNVLYLVAAGTSLLVLYYANRLSICEKNERKRINFSKIFSCGMPIVLVGIAILISVAYYHSPQITNLKNGIHIDPEGYLNDMTTDIVKQSYTNFDPSMTVDEYLMQFVGKGQAVEISSMLKDILHLREEDLVNASLNNLRARIAEGIGIDLKGDEKIFDLVVGVVISKINIFIKNYYVVFSILLPIGMFFAIKFVGVFILWLSLFVSYLVFKILIQTGAIVIEIEKEPVEVIRC